jgi:ribose transport system ATP-binding protein/rhamnose transport system ATP-binding protein
MNPSLHLEALDITKSFAGTRALAGANLALSAGEIHALLGVNGAGKSTLSRVISGHVQRDSGTILLKGRKLDLRSPREAIEAGITMVMQETSLVPDMSVIENIFLPHLGRPGRLSYAAMRRQAGDILAELGQAGALSPDAEVRKLSVAQRQLVEIAKALALKSDLIIFDEPTASLSPGEVERLFDVIVTLKQAGCAIVFVSHRLEEVFALTDSVTVMREGRTVAASLATGSLNQAELIRLLIGREIGQIFSPRPPPSASPRPVVLEVEHLRAPPAVRDVSFALHQGEILGLGGLVGAGRSETVEAIFGLRPRSGGTIRLQGELFSPRSPTQAIRAGIGLVAEDRRVQSIVPDFTVRENLLLGHLGAHRGFGLAYGKLGDRIDELMARLDLPTGRLADASMFNLSGGMQQKIIIARWLLLEPRVLILDEPTKGVDIGTRASIYAILRDIAARGVGVIVVSSDFQELLGICERIVVMSDGVATANVESALLDEEKLTLFAAPRSSMETNLALLRELSSTYGGSAFWAIVDGERVFCLNVVRRDDAADPGLVPGATPRLEETRIARALAARSAVFVTEPATALQTLIVDARTPRGHDLGTIGLVLPAGRPPPDADAIRARIASVFEHGV